MPYQGLIVPDVGFPSLEVRSGLPVSDISREEGRKYYRVGRGVIGGDGDSGGVS